MLREQLLRALNHQRHVAPHGPGPSVEDVHNAFEANYLPQTLSKTTQNIHGRIRDAAPGCFRFYVGRE